MAARGNYTLARSSGELLFVSGQGPIGATGTLRGTVGADVSLDEAKHGARDAGLHLLAAAAGATGDVDRIRSVLNLTVYVRAADDFTDHPIVADGCSDFFADVFGEDGLASRAAVGVSTLPFGLALEAAAVFELTTPALVSSDA